MLLLLFTLLVPLLGACGTSSDTSSDESEPGVAIEQERDEAEADDNGDAEAEDEAAQVSPVDDGAPESADDAPSADEVMLDFVAAVNGQGLLLGEYQRQAFDTQRYFVERGLDPSSEEGQAELQALRRGVLLDMIHQSLIEQAAQEMDITASDEEVAESLAEFEDALAETMDETNVTAEEVADMERKAIIGRKFVDQIAKDVPSEAPYYHARHVLCSERGPCEAALTRLEAGEDFVAVAAEVSEDETTANRGGDLDWIPRLDGINVLPSAELEAALFALEPGQRSPVIESDFGYHVVELIEIDAARALDDDQSFQLRQRSVETWLADAVRRADIVIYPEDLQDIIAAR
jgi:parvulin-like peptidyl-prolyl isomerase